MSNALLPTMAGLMWGTRKTPGFNTGIQRAADLSELRVSLASAPVWTFRRGYDVLRDDATHAELETLAGFFLARYGAFDSWLFADPDDSVATAEPFGTGDGTTTAFQLRRAWGAFGEPCANIAAGALIYKAGGLQTSGTDYTISNGAVTFASAPANGAALTWSGTYYFRCRFKADAQEFEQFMRQLWQARNFEFIGSLGLKI